MVVVVLVAGAASWLEEEEDVTAIACNERDAKCEAAFLLPFLLLPALSVSSGSVVSLSFEPVNRQHKTSINSERTSV